MPFDGSQLDDVTKLLIEGRERIEQGWCQGAMRERGAVCMIGAITGPEISGSYAAIRRLGRVLGFSGPGACLTDLPRWNDTAGRTKDEVLQAYDRAIAGE